MPALLEDQIKVQQQLINVITELFTGQQNAVYSKLDYTEAPNADALVTLLKVS
jgi:hypothetical protein